LPNTASKDSASPVILAVATAPERRIVERSNLSAYGGMPWQTGIGPEQVRSRTEAMLAVKPAGLISIGTAGGLTADQPPGRLLMPLSVTTEDGQVFSITPAWHTRVCAQLAVQDPETGCLVSVSQPACDSQNKQQLQVRTGAVAVDMESAELARLALLHSIPFLVIRVVADPYDQPLPRSAIAALTNRGDMHLAGLLGQLLRRPGEITGLLRLNNNFRAASRSLEACCRAAGKQICDPDPQPLL